ncbi:MAG TPA: glycosyltransferase family 4 protein [Alphaproteobacteria bacterium]
MRILFLTENFPPETNAAATRVFERAVYWVEAGHSVTVITSAPNFPHGKIYAGYRNRWHQTETRDGIRVVRVKTFMAPNEGVVGRTLDFVSFMASGVAGGLLEARPDVVIATSPQFFAAIGGWMLGALRRVPFIFELGDLWPASVVAVGAMKPSLPLRWMEKLELFLYRRSAAVVALTSAFKRNLIGRGIDPAKIAVVINGVDLRRYEPRPRDRELSAQWGVDEKFVVGYIGTLGMAHGLLNVLDAAERLRDHDAIRFVLVGPGAERAALMAEAERRRLTNVLFLAQQPKEMMPRAWSLCDVALIHLKNSPTFAEVIPSKMFEAMAMGLPLLVAAPAGEASAITEAEKCGLHVPAADPEALAAATLTLWRQPDLRRTMALAARSAAPRYSRERQARDMARVIAAVVAGDGTPAAALA